MKKTNIIKHITSIIFTTAIIAFASCTIGLGEAVDMHGPAVTITSPEARENVKDKFTIAGTVSDDFDIWHVVVTIKDGNTVKGEWKNENNTWSYRKDSSDSFAPYSNATWNLSDDEKSAEWSIKDANIEGQGTFTIVVSAIDKSGNASEESTKSRDIIIDGTPPAITISSPKLSDDKKTFNIPDYKDITKISLFQTGDFTISGNAKDDNSIVSLTLVIKDAENAKSYFEKTITLNDVDSLRSWEIPVTLKDCGLKDLDNGKHVLEIFTKTADAAGNTNDDLVSQGYTCLWKAADQPWIEFATLSNSSIDAPISIYTGSPLQFAAYDDTALSKVTVTIKHVEVKTDGSGNITSRTVKDIVTGYNEKVLWSSSGSEKENNAQVKLDVPEECEQYYIELNAVDKKGNEADTIKGYVKVEDKTFPSIDISYAVGNTDKTSGDTLFGDANGNFKIKMKAFDDTEVKSIKMAYIVNKNDVLEYANKNNALWNTVTPAVTTDTSDNKRWEIAVGSQTGTDTSIGIIRKVYEPSKALNIFTDLGINGKTRPLGTQTFVFRIEDNNGNALTKTYSIQGDIEAPTISFTKIGYYSNGSTLTNEYVKGSTDKLPAFGENTKIKVYGNISDNSKDAWGNLKILTDIKKLTFELLLNSETKCTPVINADGSFTAEIGNLASSPSLSFSGTVTDYNKNSSSDNISFVVNTHEPKVEAISSRTPDGCYGVGAEINIFIRFNQLFTLKKGTSNPTLTLNNGATATMVMDNDDDYKNTSVFNFTYKVQSSDNEEDKLDVTKVDLKGGKISDTKGTDSTELTPKLTSQFTDYSLADKNITIITSAPKLLSGYPKLDEENATVTLKYDKKIARGTGDITITQQKLKEKTNITDPDAYEDGVDKVPAVLTEKQYNALKGYTDMPEPTPNPTHNPAPTPHDISYYYTKGTNGADSTFKANTEEKYVLNYNFDSDNTGVVKIYTKARAHILSQNIKSNKVEISSDEKIVTIKFTKNDKRGTFLPCKGATYEIFVPAGFVQDKTGGKAFPVAEAKKDITSAGIEDPVIRLYAKGTVIKDSSATEPGISGTMYIAEQPKKAKFKIDCQSDYDSLTYHYDFISYNNSEVYTTKFSDAAGTVVTKNFGKTGKTTSRFPTTAGDEETYNGEKEIGDNTVKMGLTMGLTYNITATATKSGSEPSYGYAKACRTGIAIQDLDKLHSGELLKDHEYTTKSEWLGKGGDTGTNNKKIGLFLKGGDNESGGNTVKTLPITWTPTETEYYLMFTEEANGNFYLLSWDINSPKLYFWFNAGIMDEATKTDAEGRGSNGPTHSISAQNNYTNHYKKFYVEPGEFMIIYNKVNKNEDVSNVEFQVQDYGKPLKVR